MKIFYCGQRYDHYDPKRGLSFENNNFYLTLAAYPGAEVKYFAFDRILEVGKEKFNQELLDAVKNEKPDMVFCFMYSDEFDKNALEEMKKHTKTVCWFSDDSWRFYNYSKFWAKHFTWAITTYSYMPELFKKAGQPNVIRSQWAANTEMYHPRPSDKQYAVSFVGGITPLRKKIIDGLQAARVPVEAFGGGWDNGRISDEKMLEIFANSKINLGLNPPPGMWTKNSLGRLIARASIDKFVPDFHLISNMETFTHQNIRQIKARHFEIPACGGLVFTSPADDLETYYVPGKEMVLYEDQKDLIEKINYYLAHEDERAAIAKAGYERTIREHTYQKRFEEIFRAIGLI